MREWQRSKQIDYRILNYSRNWKESCLSTPSHTYTAFVWRWKHIILPRCTWLAEIYWASLNCTAGEGAHIFREYSPRTLLICQQNLWIRVEYSLFFPSDICVFTVHTSPSLFVIFIASSTTDSFHFREITELWLALFVLQKLTAPKWILWREQYHTWASFWLPITICSFCLSFEYNVFLRIISIPHSSSS